MSQITFLRRKGLGAGSVKGMTAYLNSCPVSQVSPILTTGSGTASVMRNDRLHRIAGGESGSPSGLIIRWGCTTQTGVPLEQQLNVSSAITRVNNKMMFRQTLQENQSELVPNTLTSGSTSFPNQVPSLLGDTPLLNQLRTSQLVLRPAHHAQGRNLFVTDISGIEQIIRGNPRLFARGWYASELIDKVAEYRVYVVSGRVATVAKKTPADPSAIAWNVAQGGRFDVVRWGEWPLEACRVAIEAFKYSGLDFSGVDVMIDRDGRAYVIELNSAPSLPLLSDGSVSYRQRCMADCFKYIVDNGKQHFDTPEGYDNWRQVIHPAVHSGE